MPGKTSRVPSRVPSRRASRAASVVSTETAGTLPVDNVSFVSHLSGLGHGAGGGPSANLDDITAAAAALVGASGPRSETGSVHAAAASVRSGGTADGSHRTGAAHSATGVEAAGEAILEDNVPFFTIVKQFLLVGYPLSLSTLAQFSLNMVIVSVNGKMLGNLELGGASLATGLVNATGFAFGAGLCGAIETVLPHTFGAYQRQCQSVEEENAARVAEWEQERRAKEADSAQSRPSGLPPGVSASAGASESNDNDSDAASSSPSLLLPPQTLYMYGIYTQRMAVILFIVAFPLGVILLFADLGLAKLGESSAVLHYTGVWCRYAVFGVPATLTYQLLQRYFSCQTVTKPLSVAMVSAALLNPLLQITFVKLFGFSGSPVAWLLLMCAIVGGLVGYLKYTGMHKLTWGGWNEKSLQNLGSLTRLAIPSMGVMLSEWVALEVNALAGGFAPTDQLAAYSITLQAFGAMWGIGSGVMALAAVFVGSAVGAGKPMLARRIAFVAIGVMFSVAVADVIIMYCLGSVIPWIFTNDPAVVELYQGLMYYVLPYHIADTFQSTVMGIFRGCEMQKLGAAIITVAFCVIGVPLSFLLFFHFDIGVRALWIGPFTGVLCFGVPCYLYILLRYVKWEELRPHSEDIVIPVEEDEEDAYGEAAGLYQDNDTPITEHTVGKGGKASDLIIDSGDAHVREYVDDTVRQTRGSPDTTPRPTPMK